MANPLEKPSHVDTTDEGNNTAQLQISPVFPKEPQPAVCRNYTLCIRKPGGGRAKFVMNRYTQPRNLFSTVRRGG